jgi:hypothetical protein
VPKFAGLQYRESHCLTPFGKKENETLTGQFCLRSANCELGVYLVSFLRYFTAESKCPKLLDFSNDSTNRDFAQISDGSKNIETSAEQLVLSEVCELSGSQ